MKEHRLLHVIARDIRKDWKKVSVHAEPYLSALSRANKVTDRYIIGDHYSTICGLLANLSTYRGETARAIKIELKAIKVDYEEGK